MKKKIKNVFYKIISYTIFLMLITSCADATHVQECLTEKPYGFFGGLWHGLIAPISFFGSLFFDSIAMYAVNNNGGWYDFGFVIGAGILFRIFKLN